MSSVGGSVDCVMEGDLQRLLGPNLRGYRLHRSLRQGAFVDVVGVHRTHRAGWSAASAAERDERAGDYLQTQIDLYEAILAAWWEQGSP